MTNLINNFIALLPSPASQRVYKYTIERFLKHYNDSPPKTADWPQSYITHLKSQNLSNSTINTTMVILRKFYKHAFNLAIEVPRLKQLPSTVEFLTEPQVHALLEAAEPAFFAVLLFALDTGCRVSEIASVSRNSYTTVPSEFIIIGKGGHQRQVLISPDTKAVLEHLLTDGLIFGRKWTVRGIQYNLSLTAKRAGIHGIHPHMLRHTLATQMMQQGVAIQDIQHILGHKNISTTQIYTHITDSRLRQVWGNFQHERELGLRPSKNHERNQRDNKNYSILPVL